VLISNDGLGSIEKRENGTFSSAVANEKNLRRDGVE
jgi:hypothetical protein